jgi:hypothetical protein
VFQFIARWLMVIAGQSPNLVFIHNAGLFHRVRGIPNKLFDVLAFGRDLILPITGCAAVAPIFRSGHLIPFQMRFKLVLKTAVGF